MNRYERHLDFANEAKPIELLRQNSIEGALECASEVLEDEHCQASVPRHEAQRLFTAER